MSEISLWGMNIGEFVLMEVRCAVCMFMSHYCNISDYRPLTQLRLLVFNCIIHFSSHTVKGGLQLKLFAFYTIAPHISAQSLNYNSFIAQMIMDL